MLARVKKNNGENEMKSAKRILALALVLAMVLSFCACSAKTKMIGRWNIQTIEVGDMVIDDNEIEEMGLVEGGHIKLNKSGSCIVNILGDEFEGKWKVDDNGVATITYDKDKEGTAKLDGEVLLFTDAEGNDYKLEK